jgi:hypothetical protein
VPFTGRGGSSPPSDTRRIAGSTSSGRSRHSGGCWRFGSAHFYHVEASGNHTQVTDEDSGQVMRAEQASTMREVSRHVPTYMIDQLLAMK